MLSFKEVGKLLLLLALGGLIGAGVGALSLVVEGRAQPTLSALWRAAPWR